ncbi:unnamed protein product, partial [marine sediment metagenome]
MKPMFKKLKLKNYKKRIINFWSQYRENKMGLLGLFILLFFVFTSVFAEILSPYPIGPRDGDRKAILKPPSSKYLLGTDELGRDMLSLLLQA